MLSREHNMNESTNNISIKQKLSLLMKDQKLTGEYSLKQNCFDPSKSSPPNEFMIKLHMRMNLYHKNIYVDMNVASLDNE
jgi:hypothetical protein